MAAIYIWPSLSGFSAIVYSSHSIHCEGNQTVTRCVRIHKSHIGWQPDQHRQTKPNSQHAHHYMAVVGGFIDFWRCVFASGGPTLVWTRWKNGASMSRAAIKLGVLAHGALIASCSSSNTMMSISVSGGESYPGRSFSVSQLLYAAKGKLQSPTFCGRCVRAVVSIYRLVLNLGFSSMTTAVSQAEVKQKRNSVDVRILGLHGCVIATARPS